MATGLLVATVESGYIADMQCQLADGETIVGTQVNVRHLGPALPGTACARGRGRWGARPRRAAFDVTVIRERARVATARLVVAVVAAARFAAGLERRHEAAALLAA